MTAEIENIPIVSVPFGYGDNERDYSILDDEEVRSSLCVPSENNGIQFTRHMMNGIAYAASIGTYLYQMGYPSGVYREKVAQAIGGYPKGAILSFIDDNGYVREYESKVDDNMEPFPTSEGESLAENDYWRPIFTSNKAFGITDYSSIVQQATLEEVTTSRFQLETTTLTETSNVFISASVEKLATTDVMLFGFPDIQIYTVNPNGDSVTRGRIQFLGQESVTQNFMVGAGSKVGIKCNNYNHTAFGVLSASIVAYKVQSE